MILNDFIMVCCYFAIILPLFCCYRGLILDFLLLFLS